MCNAASSLPPFLGLLGTILGLAQLRPYYFAGSFLFFDTFHLPFFSFFLPFFYIPRNIRSHYVSRPDSSTVVSYFNVIRGSSYLSSCIQSKTGSIFVACNSRVARVVKITRSNSPNLHHHGPAWSFRPRIARFPSFSLFLRSFSIPYV